MDIHDTFFNSIPDLRKVMEEINELNKKSEEDISLEDINSPSEWDIFEKFLNNLVKKDERFKEALIRIIFNEDEDLHEKIKSAFCLLTYDEKDLVKLVYDGALDRVTIDYNKAEIDE